ncbi:hypothetical protein BCU68_03755 [Vibrio sp. 10N.286.49.B3]|uniref:hypothetical protein n=1 Tax=Vibrio sp. 10N.286.49.B3 TaxID=1880855 RepID=UPI000CC13585|nr:hypothetical protein [Vibrio sp. 10N.286.49.B3]PMH43115.1 hypothetical protein BCU68_03755 [Vibrio sp. 10N.286.49.B3]
MPDTYCSSCKKTTAHKAIMRRCKDEQEETILRSFQHLMSQFINAGQHYKMEEVLLCRYCNQQNVNLHIVQQDHAIEELGTAVEEEKRQVNA